MENKVNTPAQYFRDLEIGRSKESLESWLSRFLWAKKFGEYQSGGDNTNIYIEDGIVYIKFLGGGIPEQIPLDDLITTVQSRLEALGINPQSIDGNHAWLKKEEIESNPAFAIIKSVTETRELMMYLSLRLQKSLTDKTIEVTSDLRNMHGIPSVLFTLSIADFKGNLIKWNSRLGFFDSWSISTSVVALGKDWQEAKAVLRFADFESSDLRDVISHLSALPKQVEVNVLSKSFLQWFSPEN